MEIIVEIGTTVQQELIRGEISFLVDILEGLPLMQKLNRKLTKIIVADDFSRATNAAQGTVNYSSHRGIGLNKVNALAKVVESESGITMLLSRDIYNEFMDDQIRTFVFFHEICHVLTKNIFPSLITNIFAIRTYLANLYVLYDEYFADRLAFQIVDNIVPKKSTHWDMYWSNSIKGFIELLSDNTYYELLLDRIQKFRVGEIENVDTLMISINQIMDEISLSTIHLFAVLHSFKNDDEDSLLSQSKFVNQRTNDLIQYLKDKYEGPDHDLTDGVDVIAGYFANFGFRLEDLEQGGYIRILDI
ncbi:hypothetical protein [Candidatus Leptofilum sp.]|uniref:hypothetical protein n=1 Tax=Candidatus Leptofilum sp. TaxID=3241576 RepID=UPI003B5A621D